MFKYVGAGTHREALPKSISWCSKEVLLQIVKEGGSEGRGCLSRGVTTGPRVLSLRRESKQEDKEGETRYTNSRFRLIYQSSSRICLYGLPTKIDRTKIQVGRCQKQYFVGTPSDGFRKSFTSSREALLKSIGVSQRSTAFDIVLPSPTFPKTTNHRWNDGGLLVHRTSLYKQYRGYREQSTNSL